MKRRDVLNICQRKRVRFGLGIRLGLEGYMSGCLGRLHEREEKVRVRVRVRNGR